MMEAFLTIVAAVMYIGMLLGIIGFCIYMLSLLYMAMKGIWLILYSGNRPMRIATDPKILEKMQKDTERLINARDRKEMYGDSDEYAAGNEADFGVDLEYRRMGGR